MVLIPVYGQYLTELCVDDLFEMRSVRRCWRDVFSEAPASGVGSTGDPPPEGWINKNYRLVLPILLQALLFTHSIKEKLLQ
jgi:hypothetical protein